MTEVKYDLGNGQEISVEYDEHNITKITRELFESLIEKQIPKKPIDKIMYKECHICGAVDLGRYCMECGQKLEVGE